MGAKPEKDNPRQPIEEANKYRSTQDSQQAEDLLLQLHEASLKTSVNGTLFWNGPNEVALAKLASEWSQEDAQAYVTLEGGTSVGYVNKRFVWGDEFESFVTKASAKLALAASGHVPAVCRFGLRNDSILTHTELPRMINLMHQQLSQGQAPSITDISIIVINPIGSNETFSVFTNSDIVNLMTWGRIKGENGWFINPSNSSECQFVQPLGQFWVEKAYAKYENGKPWVKPGTQTSIMLPPDVKMWWQRRHPAEHPLVTKITKQDVIDKLFNYSNMNQPHQRPGFFPARK